MVFNPSRSYCWNRGMVVMAFSHVQFDTYTRKWEEAYRGINKLKEQFQEEIADLYLKRLEEVSPVDTGLLSQSWYISNIKPGTYRHIVEVSNDATNEYGQEYASWVEDGHHTVNGGWWEGYHMSQVASISVQRGAGKRWDNRYKSWLKARGLL